MMIKKLLFLLLLFSLINNSFALTNITDCGTYTASDTYHLINNIDITSEGTCIVLQNHNITFDCQDYNITYIGEHNGIFSDGYDNITIQNCNLYHNTTDSDWIVGIYNVNGDNIVLFNNTFWSDTGAIGFQFHNVTNGNMSYNFVNITNESFDSYGIRLWSVNDSIVSDNTVKIYGEESLGILLLWNYIDIVPCVNNTVTNNSVATYGLSSMCIYGIVGSTTNISYNTIESTSDFTGDFGSIKLIGYNGSFVHDNTISVDGDYNLGIMLIGYEYGSINNQIYSNQIITASSVGGHGIRFETVSDSNISYNNITTLSGHGIILTQVNDNYVRIANITIAHNYLDIGSSSNAIYLRGQNNYYEGMYDYCIIEDNTIIDNGGLQLSAFAEYWNNTNLKDQSILDYWITAVLFSFEDSSYGLVNFTEPISSGGMRSDLIGTVDSDIVFGDNYVWVNGSVSSLNKSANITLYGIGDRGYSYPAILKDGIYCDDCVNYTDLTAETVLFSVTGFSNYSIGEYYPPSEATEWYGFDLIGSTETFVNVMWIIIPLLAVLSIVFVFRESFSGLIPKLPKL